MAAMRPVPASCEEGVPLVNEVMSLNTATHRDEDGDYSDWIELYNPGDAQIDLAGYGLSDRAGNPHKWIFPQLTLAPRSHLLVFASGKDRRDVLQLHTNFGLSAAGETLLLTDAEGNTCDEVELGQARPDISLGRQPDGASNWVFFPKPTPGTGNTVSGVEGYAVAVTPVPPGGLYDGGIAVVLRTDSPSATVRYTLDGSEPTGGSPVYTSPVRIDSTTVVRARAFETGLLPGSIATHTYFIDEDITLPIVSLSSPPDGLFSEETGIYVFGPNASYESPVPYWDANFWQDWERPAHIEIFETDGRPALSADVGLSIGAGWSRLFPQKSFSIDARAKYGYSTLEYRFFPELPIDSFDTILLRNGGNDSAGSLLRDALGSRLGIDVGLDVKARRPVVAFVNGAYWGVYAFREKFNVDYLVNHFDVDADEVDLIEKVVATDEVPEHDNVQAGSVEDYRALVDFVAEHDMRDAANYDYVQARMDVPNFITYCVTKIYACDYNFSTNNVRWWRPRTPEGRWRWLLYDNDRTFESRSSTTYTVNMLRTALRSIVGDELLVSLLRNSSFRHDFVNRLADLLNTAFLPERVIDRLHELKTQIEPEMERHIVRWDIDYWQGQIGTLANWYADLQVIETFAQRRPEFVADHFRDQFDLGDDAVVDLTVSPSGAGAIRLNSIALDGSPWSGTYFRDVPLRITALPSPGYRFAGWSGSLDAVAPSIDVTPTGDISLTATFTGDSSTSDPVVMTEVNYNSSAESDPEDWVELHNLLDIPVDVSGWVFRDAEDAHGFVIPAGTIIAAGGYLVLCRDAAAFRGIFPDVGNHIGDLGFGLSNGGESLRLYSVAGTLIDSVAYGDATPWPVEADGTGATLALRDPRSDNSRAESWTASGHLGTPGASNGRITAVEMRSAPAAFFLGQNYPNPFNATTSFRFSLPVSGPVSLAVYNAMGQKERDLVAGELASGPHILRWDGRDDRGAAVSSGVYFYRLRMGEQVATRALVHIK